MKSIFKILILFISFQNSFPQSGWVEQFSGTEDSLRSVKFLNSQTGWTTGTNGILLRTVNSGVNWTIINTTFTNDLQSIYIISDSVIYVCGDSGFIIKTTNAGNIWIQLKTETKVKLNSINFINSQTGWTCGYEGIILKTSNAGNNWLQLNSNSNTQLNSIYFINPDKGWTAGNGSIYYSSNGGNNWTSQFTDGRLVLNSIYFIDSINGWTGYYDNKTFGPEVSRTTDGGNSWINYTMNNSYSLSIYFTSPNTGWSSGYYGKLNYSTDGGVNWHQQLSGTIEHLNSIYFTDSMTGWTVGNSGTILKTTTGGILTGFSNNNSSVSHDFKLKQNYPNPFNPSTIISYTLSKSIHVDLKITDLLGREIVTLVNEKQKAGNYEVGFERKNLPSGIFYYTLKTADYTETKRMLLLK